MGDFIDELPKCELHVHLEGTLEPEMACAMEARHSPVDGSAGGPADGSACGPDLTSHPTVFNGLFAMRRGAVLDK